MSSRESGEEKISKKKKMALELLEIYYYIIIFTQLYSFFNIKSCRKIRK